MDVTYGPIPTPTSVGWLIIFNEAGPLMLYTVSGGKRDVLHPDGRYKKTVMPSRANMLKWIDTQADVMEDRVQRWCAINSHASHTAGLSELSRDVGEVLSALGEVESIELPPARQINDAGQEVSQPLAPALSVRVRGDAAKQVLLVIHLDTVYLPDSCSSWSGFSGPRSRSRAPGGADARGGIAVMLTALQAFEQTEAAAGLGYRVILNTDEEIGSPGSAALLTEAASEAHVGMVFEPALPDGNLIGARKGSGNFTVVLTGRSAHAGRAFNTGRNAVVVAAELAVQLHQLNQREDTPGTPGITINVGRIVGGGAVNMVPDTCVLRFNVRVENESQQQDVMTQIQSMLDPINQRDGYTATLHGRFNNPPKPLTSALTIMLEQVQQIAQTLGMTLTYKPSGGVCDGNKLAAAGLATVDTLGPVGGEIHSPNEYIDLDSLTQRAKLTAGLLYAYATNELPLPTAKGST